MEKLERRLRGYLRLELCVPEPETLLNDCLLEGLDVLEMQAVDACTLRLGVFEGQLTRLEALTQRRGGTLRVLSRSGGSSTRALLKRRLALLLAAALTLVALFVSTLFVWEIRVVGGEGISRARVLRALEDCGVSSGSFWPAIDADAVRDRMLLRLPELAWMTVNVRGSVAELRLLQRREKPPIFREDEAADLVASHSGVIRRMTVLSGRALVQPGQAVAAGQTLLSAELDSITAAPRYVRAQGEVWADTWYELTAACPVGTGKTAAAGKRGRLALTVGKKRINFYRNRGKAIDGCDKIVHEYKCGVEGVFLLPVTLVWEEWRAYRETESASANGEQLRQGLLAALSERIEGEIVSAAFVETRQGDTLFVTLRAQCCENIAQTADRSDKEGAYDRENHRGRAA